MKLSDSAAHDLPRLPQAEPKSGTEIMALAALLAVISEVRLAPFPPSRTGRRRAFAM